jgi:hypothetical protein
MGSKRSDESNLFEEEEDFNQEIDSLGLDE